MGARALALGGLLAVLALVAGALVLWAQPTEFGWFAYADPPDDASPRLVVLTGRRELALLLASLAVLVIGALGGYAVGRRVRRGTPG